MNLRIGPGELRFRITKEELERLLLGDALKLQVLPFPEALICLEENASHQLFIRQRGDQLVLSVHKLSAQELLASLPNREGLEAEQPFGAQHLKLLLEVDIRSQKRRRG